jgi:hypothetical protein
MSHTVFASGAKQSYQGDGPARNAGLPVIRHPGLRSCGSAGVPAGFGAIPRDAGRPVPPSLDSRVRGNDDLAEKGLVAYVGCGEPCVSQANRIARERLE